MLDEMFSAMENRPSSMIGKKLLVISNRLYRSSYR